MYCSNCGKEYSGSFCPECGTPAQGINKKMDCKEINNYIIPDGEKDIEIYKLSAGPLAINGERQLVTVFEIKGDEIAARSYRRTTQSSPASSCVFHKQEVGNIIYKKTSYYSKLDKASFVGLTITTILGFLIPPLLLAGPLAIILTVLRGRKNTMVIALKNGTHINAFYTDQNEVSAIYNILMN